MRQDGLVVGTSVHGLFEDETIRRSLVTWLRHRSGTMQGRLPPGREGNEGQDDPYDRWADVLTASLDIDRLVAACGIVDIRRCGT